MPGLEVRDTPDFLDAHSRDHTEDLQFLPDVVALPKNTAEVSSLLAWANARRVPVTAAGAWTGLSGGALPVKGGISLSTKRLNRIVKIDELHHQLVVQPGVIVQEMQEAVQAKGLFYAVDPASRGTCTIGETSLKTVAAQGLSNTASPRTGCSTSKWCSPTAPS